MISTMHTCMQDNSAALKWLDIFPCEFLSDSAQLISGCIYSHCYSLKAEQAGLLLACNMAACGLDRMDIDPVIYFQVPMNKEVRWDWRS